MRSAEQIVPESMQLSRTPAGTSTGNLDHVAASIAIRLYPSEPRSRLQRLMQVADQMQQPGKIVRSDVVRSRRVCQGPLEQRYLGLSVRGHGILKRCTVGGKWLVDEMPIFMTKMIGITDVLRRLRRVRRYVAVAVSVVVVGTKRLDLVRPGSGFHEGDQVALRRTGD